MRKFILLFIPVIVLLVYGISCAKPPEVAKAVEGVPVSTVKPQKQDISVFYDTSATVKANDVRTLSFAVAGSVNILVKEDGERISAGELLASVDKESYANGLKAAESNLSLSIKQHNAAKVQRDVYANQLRDAENDLAEKEKDYNRYERLFHSDVVTAKELEEKELSYKSAKIFADNARNALQLSEGAILVAQDGVDAASAQRDIAKKQLDDSIIAAPFNGTISKKFIEKGTVTGPGIPVYEIVADGGLKIEASLPERYLNNINDGSLVLVDIPNSDCAIESQKITRVHREINSKTGNFEVTIDLTDINGCLRHGMFAHLSFEIAREDGVLCLPSGAILELSGQKIVYVVQGDKAVKTPVETGLESEDYVEIRTGLTGNENVILSGNKYVVDSTVVRVIEQSTSDKTNQD